MLGIKDRSEGRRDVRVNPKALQAFMGHANITTTLDFYVFTDDSDHAAAVEAMPSLVTVKS